jgi:hypothetical protein
VLWVLNLLAAAVAPDDEWATVRNISTVFAVLASAGALALGFVNFRRARRLDKRDLFLRIHEALLAPEVVAGRRALYSITDQAQAAALVYQEEVLTQVYRALAMFDVLALYAENGWIDEKTVLDEWGNSLARSVTPADHFIKARYDSIQWHSWPHYRLLAQKASARPDH